MNLNDFVVLLPCAAALIIGFLIKNAVKIIPNRYIPLICAAVGVGINIWINFYSGIDQRCCGDRYV